MVLAVEETNGSLGLHALPLGEKPNAKSLIVDYVNQLQNIWVRDGEPNLEYSIAAKAVWTGTQWVLAYTETDDGLVYLAAATDETTRVQLAAEPQVQWVGWNLDGSPVPLRGSTFSDSENQRCLTTAGLEPVEQVAEGHSCRWINPEIAVASTSGPTTLEYQIYEGTDRYELRFPADTYDGGSFSANGHYFAIPRLRDQGVQFELYDVRSGELLARSQPQAPTEWRIHALGSTGSLISAYVDHYGPDQTVLLFDPSRPEVLVVDGAESAQMSPDDEHFVVGIPGVSEYRLVAFHAETLTENELAVLDERPLTRFLPDGSMLIVTRDGQVIQATMTGATTTIGTIEAEQDVSILEVWPLSDDAVVLLSGAATTDWHGSLDVVRLAEPSITSLAVDWARLQVEGIDPRGDLVLVTTTEWTDESALLALHLDDPHDSRVLDPGAGSGLEVVAFDGDDVIYNVGSLGQPEVRRASLASDLGPTVLYRNARILAASWHRHERPVSCPVVEAFGQRFRCRLQPNETADRSSS